MILFQFACSLVKTPDAVAHMHRHSNGAALVGDGTGYRLSNPPGSVRAEAITSSVVELFYCLHQAKVTLLNQVQKWDTAPHILLGDADH